VTTMLISDFVVIGDVHRTRLRLQSNQRCNVGDAPGLRLAFDIRRVSAQHFSHSVSYYHDKKSRITYFRLLDLVILLFSHNSIRYCKSPLFRTKLEASLND
jgi:hypothetical protein